MPNFPHLPLRSVLNGTYKFKGFAGRGKSERSIENLKNRVAHARNLSGMIDRAEYESKKMLALRREQGLAELPHGEIVPVLLEVDTQIFDIESLKGFGFEIISEENEGFIIGANFDQFKSLREKIKQFVEENNQGTALLWSILDGNSWRPEYILTEELYAKYKQGLKEDEHYIVDKSIACYLKKNDYPQRSKTQSEKAFKKCIHNWEEKNRLFQEKLSDLMFSRQMEVQKFVELGGGMLIDGFVEYEDSFGFRAKLSGLGLKDLLRNYQYVFEIAEHSDMENEEVNTKEFGAKIDLELVAPPGDAPRVVVIDSGIQQNHRLISKAIDVNRSINFVPEDTTVADEVGNGGHGTKVAGAILYSGNIPKFGTHQLPFFLVNARVLNRHNQMSNLIYPPRLMQDIANEYKDITIFNLSINAHSASRKTHMSQWSSMMDKIAHAEDKIFVVSAGNLLGTSGVITKPGIKEHIAAGRNHPHYLLEDSSRIADPGQSAFAITVGSVCHDEYNDLDRKSFGRRDEISAFSRSGFGMWNAIKPEVVEYGGDVIKEKLGPNLSILPQTSTEVVKTGPVGLGYDIGTSFAAPKVAHIIAHLQSMFPNENSLFYKALLIQSARLPEAIFHNPTADHLRQFGYGIPNLARAINNSPYRITFTTSGKIAPKQGKIFSINIPPEIRRQGEQFDVLVEVALAYTAKPRRTRRYLRSYLSSWLSWESSKLNQDSEAFKHDILKEIESPEKLSEDEYEPEDPRSIKWSIWNNGQWGRIKGVRRQASPNQKDWVVMKSYELPAELSFAIIGHKGWETDLTEEAPFSFVVSFEILNEELEIYEIMSRVNIDVPISVGVRPK
jgi:hypothetical protein